MTWQCLYQFCSDCELAYLPYADIDVTMSVTSVWVSLFIICDSSNNIIWSSSLKAETKSDEEHFQNINFISKESHKISFVIYLVSLLASSPWAHSVMVSFYSEIPKYTLLDENQSALRQLPLNGRILGN